MTRSARIMIVEDDRCIGESVRDRLESIGYDAILMTDGYSALATMTLEHQRSPVDLVLLDLRLPGMDGMVVLRELRKIYPEVPIIMMSATAEPEDAVQAINAGAGDFLPKPIDPRMLEEKCRKMLQ